MTRERHRTDERRGQQERTANVMNIQVDERTRSTLRLRELVNIRIVCSDRPFAFNLLLRNTLKGKDKDDKEANIIEIRVTWERIHALLEPDLKVVFRDPEGRLSPPFNLMTIAPAPFFSTEPLSDTLFRSMRKN